MGVGGIKILVTMKIGHEVAIRKWRLNGLSRFFKNK